MKKSYFLSLLIPLLTGCSDSESTSDGSDGKAPQYVSVTPATDKILMPGNDTIRVKYDKPVYFRAADSNRIQMDGGTITSAKAITSDSTLLLVAQVEGVETVRLTIPAGVVFDIDEQQAAGQTLTWTGKQISTDIDRTPVNADATAEAKALYALLYDNYGEKMLSAIVGESWSLDKTEEIYQLTGKYPVIATADFMFLPYNGQNWFRSYDDLTQVTEWVQKGGIFSAEWHWNVPTHGVSADVVEMASNWSSYLMVDNEAALSVLARAKAGDRIVMHYRDLKPGAQGSIKDPRNGWAGCTDSKGTSYDYFDLAAPGDWKSHGNVNCTGATFELTLDDVLAETVRQGFVISGHDYTLTAVNFVPDGEGEVGFHSGTSVGSFKCANVLTEGTLEYAVVERDLTEVASRLKALQEKGIAVLWRPLHEAAGNTEAYPGGKAWFWWGDAGASFFKRFWKHMYDRFKAEGVNNLIWVWTGSTGDANWYPGDEYVDVIGLDTYGVGSATDLAHTFQSMQETWPNKMIALSECGAIPAISDVFEAGGTWSWFMPWNGDYQEGIPNASDAWWKAAMTSDKVMTLDDIINK